MKITRGFVAVQADGMYLYISGGGSNRIDVAPVADIDDATIRHAPAGRDRKEADTLRRYGVTWLPVEVRREVVLKEAP